MLSNYHPLVRQRILYCVSKIANRDCADLSSRPEGIWVLSPSLPPLNSLQAIICYLLLLFLAKLHWKVLRCRLLCWARIGSLHHWQRCRNAIHWLDLVVAEPFELFPPRPSSSMAGLWSRSWTEMHHQKYHSLNFLRGSSSSTKTESWLCSLSKYLWHSDLCFLRGFVKVIVHFLKLAGWSIFEAPPWSMVDTYEDDRFFLSHPRSLYSGRGLWRRCV